MTTETTKFKLRPLTKEEVTPMLKTIYTPCQAFLALIKKGKDNAKN